MTSISQSRNRDYYILGSENGTIRVHVVADLSRSFALAAHDRENGFISNVAVSFDDSHLLSIARDGNFFVYRAAYDGTEYPVSLLLASVELWRLSQ